MSSNGWSLEAVRGRETGRVYALSRGATVLGNAADGGPGLDLAHQEGDSPRRMAPRQAQLEMTAGGLTVRDLDSPGGTFVNRQRLLPGQARTLQPGDLIQLGGVQLKVVAGAPPAPVAAPARTPAAPRPAVPAAKAQPSPTPAAATKTAARGGPLNAVFTLASGARCRSWDDFLTVSAQRWPAMRDELVSGRLAAFLATIGRGEIAPSAQAPGTPDERLDAWLGTLPTTRPSRPELEVHPTTLKLRASAGGGIMRANLRITNTGYRLLRTNVRIEPASATWVKVPVESSRGPIVTVDQTDLPIEVHIPETSEPPPSATVVLESNGGTRRVEVRLERPTAPDAVPDAPAAALDRHVGVGLRALIARQSLGFRLVAWSLAALLLRVFVVAAGQIVAPGAEDGRPPLKSLAVLLAALGALAAMRFALKHGEPRDLPAVGFAGGVVGVLAATLVVAACRTVEPMLGTWLSASTIGVCLLWAALGAALAVVSTLFAPPHSDAEVPS